MTTEKKVEPHQGEYLLPASLGLALGADRHEFVNMTIREVEDNKVKATKSLVIELLKLTRDLMVDRRTYKEQVMTLEAELLEANERLGDVCEALDRK